MVCCTCLGFFVPSCGAGLFAGRAESASFSARSFTSSSTFSHRERCSTRRVALPDVSTAEQELHFQFNPEPAKCCQAQDFTRPGIKDQRGWKKRITVGEWLVSC
eukprot:Sspe_Gene.15865::Locus_5537_Transcript_1_1_Confidence_1.000_Length_981::g.15865::m.15865